MKDFVPFYDNILIKKDVGETKTKTGIIMVDGMDNKDYAEADVISVGDGYKLQDGKLRPLKVKKGDHIIYRKMTEVSIKINGEDYFIVSEGNVLGVQNK